MAPTQSVVRCLSCDRDPDKHLECEALFRGLTELEFASVKEGILA